MTACTITLSVREFIYSISFLSKAVLYGYVLKKAIVSCSWSHLGCRRSFRLHKIINQNNARLYSLSFCFFFGREFTLLCKYDQLEFLKGEGSDPQPFSLDPRMLYRMSKSAFSELEAYFCLHYQRNNYFSISNNWFSCLFDDNVILNLTYCAYSIQKKFRLPLM